MPNKNIFCNVPWTNTHIYWDGEYGMCCSESKRFQTDTKINIANTKVGEWYSQRPLEDFRSLILGDKPLSNCSNCYREEQHGHESRRIRENFKSVIFTEHAFDRSFHQSPMRDSFTPITDKTPIDWHVDLGNECNLACKMCFPRASSKISSFYQKWKLIDETANRNWTANTEAWTNFLNSIAETPDLNRIHFMGGEPVLNKRFGELLQHLIDTKRTNISLSFVTNGTLLDKLIVSKLKQFRSADIEVSIESLEDNNHYIRQGSNTKQVIDNIKYLISQQTEQFHLILRTVPQLLNINNYNRLLQFALDNRVAVQSIPLVEPAYLQIAILPTEIKQKLLPQYYQLRDSINVPELSTLTTGRNVSNLELMLLREIDAMIKFLNAPEPKNVKELRVELTEWLMRWDKEFKFNAFEFYPEYSNFLKHYGYRLQH